MIGSPEGPSASSRQRSLDQAYSASGFVHARAVDAVLTLDPRLGLRRAQPPGLQLALERPRVPLCDGRHAERSATRS